MRKFFSVVLAVALVMNLGACAAFSAEEWVPDREIILIVPFAPGGYTNTIGRITAEYMSEDLGVQVIVENIPGADTMIAWNEMINRPADGYTMGMIGGVANPWGLEVLAFDKPQWTGDDFVVIGSVTGEVGVGGLVVKRDHWPDFSTFLKDVRANPGKIKFGLQGPGQANDARYWEFGKLSGLDFNFVYYSGAGDMQTDILTGDLDVAQFSANRVEFVNNESFTILAMWGESVPPDYPVQGYPFLADFEEELGFKYSDTKYVKESIISLDLMLLSKTDPAILARLEKSLETISKIPEFQEACKTAAWPHFSDAKTQNAAYRQLREDLKEFRNSEAYQEWLDKVQ